MKKILLILILFSVGISCGAQLITPALTGIQATQSVDTDSQGRQVWVFISDSTPITSQTSDTGPEPDYPQTVYESVAGVISEKTTTDFSGANDGTKYLKWGQTYYELTGRKIVGVQRGVGGSSFYPRTGDGGNNWYTSGNLYSPMVTAASQALTSLGLTKVRGILVSLGINDARVEAVDFNAGNISTAINSLITRLQTDFPGVPIFLTAPGRREITGGLSDSQTTTVRNLVLAVPSSFSNVYVTTNLYNYAQGSLNFYQADSLHITQFGLDYWATVELKYLRDNNLIENTPIIRVNNSATSTVLARFTSPSTFESNKIIDFIQYYNRKGFTSFASFTLGLFNTSTNSYQDWFRSSVASGGSWADNVGFTTDGTIGGSINTNFIPSSNATFAVTGCQAFIMLSTSSSDGTVYGARGSAANNVLDFNDTAGGLSWTVNANTASTNGSSPAAFNYSAISRASTTVQSLRINAQSTTGSPNVTNTTRPDVAVYVGARNNNGTRENPSAFTCYGWGFGASALGANMYKKVRDITIDFLVFN